MRRAAANLDASNVLLLTCPAADYKKLLPSFEEAVKSAKIDGKQTEEQSEAK